MTITASTQVRRSMSHPDAFVGKVVDGTKWNIPSGYWQCAKTHKLYPEEQLTATFWHYAFERQFLIANHIYVECADWLSDEGFDQIISTLERLGRLDEYYAYLEQPF